ncbi:hypothetical protein [Caulobacter sp. RL271]|jgi:hypothetical protein|uniref:Lipoprotein n=1 Tax=Caulobacter segnis TaxID=88688 RepID=A0ABY4ZMJ6_9CAUL|nr:hypothetical protein [Caulobacter segnis]USQ94022.1 hypothetical protein MZV50_15535 [Caulobacter segnis]
MRIWRLSLIMLALAATAACNNRGDKDTAKASKPPAASATPATELVSLAWRPANADQNLQAFELQLAGAEVIAICRTPPGWDLKAARGRIKGFATVGAAFISVDDLEDLDGLFLIRHHPGEAFGVSGKLVTGAYTGEAGQTESQAAPALLSGRPAEQCPPAKG